MHGITVRSEQESDLKAIEVVHLSAFEGDQEVALVGALRKSKTYDAELSLVAEFNGRIVGHVLLSPARIERDGTVVNILLLAPMAVVPSQSHRGIGSELVREAEARARQKGFEAIVEVGQPNYYQRLGFEPAERWGLGSNLPVETAMITARELTPGALEGGGKVMAPPQFLDLFS